MRSRDADAYLFSPREAEEARIASLTASRRTPLSCGNRVGTNRNAEAPRVLGDRYDSSVHGQATAGRSPARARRRSRRRRTSSPRARPQCERGARSRLSWANTAPTSVAPHRGDPHPPRVRSGSRRRDARALKRETHRRGLRRTRHATRRRGHEEDGVRGVSGQKTRSTCESSRQTQHRPGRGARGGGGSLVDGRPGWEVDLDRSATTSAKDAAGETERPDRGKTGAGNRRGVELGDSKPDGNTGGAGPRVEAKCGVQIAEVAVERPAT